MINVSSNKKFTYKICSDVIKATTNDSTDEEEAIRQRTLYFGIHFERFGQHKKKGHSLARFKSTTIFRLTLKRNNKGKQMKNTLFRSYLGNIPKDVLDFASCCIFL